MTGTLGAVWGVVGVLLLLGSAVFRLAPLAADVFTHELSWYHWGSLAGVVLFMAYAEGYVGFQQRFSPRVAARARYLRDHPRIPLVIFAPFFCMGYFHATRRRRMTSTILTLGIIMLVLLVRFLPQPWRGIVDAGVVVGLAWGMISLCFFSISAFREERFPFSPEVPEAG